MASRFVFDVPNWTTVVWYFFRDRRNWRELCRARIIDRQTGERFQLSEEEEAMMEVASEKMDEVANLAKGS